MNRKILVVIVLAILVFGFALSLLGREKIIATNFYKIATNIQQPVVVGDYLYFFTGSSFARIDPVTARSERLSGYFDTDGQLTVNSFNESGVVFSSSGTTASDVFGLTLLANGFSESQNSWWRYDFKTQNLQLINFKSVSSCVQFLQIQTDLYCFSPVKASQQNYVLNKYSLKTKTLESVLSIQDGFTSAIVANDSIYYVVENINGSQTLFSYNPSVNKNKKVYEGNGPILYAIDKSNVVVIDIPKLSKKSISEKELSEGSQSKNLNKLTIYYMDRGGGVVKKFNKKLGAGLLTGSNDFFVYSTVDNFYQITGSSVVAHSYSAASVGPIWDIKNSYVYVDKNNNLYSSKKLEQQKNGLDFKEKLNTPPNRFFISGADSGLNKTYINDSSLDFNGNASSVDSFLIKNKYDPNQFLFSWESLVNNPVVNNSIVTTVLN